MAKTSKPLQIWVADSVWDQAVLQPLIDQGHLVVLGDDIKDYCTADFDLMIGPQCWRATNLDNFNLMLKGSRALRYPTTKSKPAAEQCKLEL